MSFCVEIKKTREIDEKIIASFQDLKYGTSGTNFVFQLGKSDTIMVFYDSVYCGRGFEVDFEQTKLELRLSFPCTPNDLLLFRDMIIHLCKYFDQTSFLLDEQEYSLNQIDNLYETCWQISQESLMEMEQEVRTRKKSAVTILAAKNPIVLGISEFDQIQGSLEKFEILLNYLQKMDVYYSVPYCYKRKDGTIFASYYVGEEIGTVVPYKPWLMSDIQVDQYYVLLPSNRAVLYDDFIAHVEKVIDYDSAHMVVSLDENKINELVQNYSRNIETNDIISGLPYRSMLVLDEGKGHCNKINNLKLNVDPYAGMHHIEAFLWWAFDKDALNTEIRSFLQKHPSDLSKALYENDMYEGELRLGYFKEAFRSFVKKYYRFGNSGYPNDVDTYTKKTLGVEKYYSKDFRNEAYLFLPFDNKYIEDLKEIIEREFRKGLL